MSTLDFGYGGDAGFTYANLGLLGSDSVSWTFEEDKFFETSLAQYDGSWPITGDDYWGQLQEQMPQKGVHDLKNRFSKLEDDVRNIEAGLVQLPDYDDDSDHHVTAEVSFNFAPAKPLKATAPPPTPAPAPVQAPAAKKSKAAPKTGEQERRKGVPWTEEEHKLFLLGLNKFGKGDWRSISRNFVISRTPTQVASHAQKYFIRLNSMSKKDNKRRSSIHDITSATGKD